MTNFVRNVQLTRKKRTGCHGLQGRSETTKRLFSDIYRTNRLPKERKISLNKKISKERGSPCWGDVCCCYKSDRMFLPHLKDIKIIRFAIKVVVVIDMNFI